MSSGRDVRTLRTRRAIETRRVLRVGVSPGEASDAVAGEEPMEIRVGGPGGEPVAVAVVMRTPGSDFELAAGFLLTEGIVGGRDDVASIGYCEPPEPEQEYNVVTVRLRVPFDAERLRRSFYASSSCGVCGKSSIEQLEVACPVAPPGPYVAPDVVASLPEAMRRRQKVFDKTGGLHACALFDPTGGTIALREDVGRHNALDKLCGWSLLNGRIPLRDEVLMVSGRVSFEIVQKAAVAGIAVVCAVSAPTSLAVDAAERLGLTVVGFVRGLSFNVYTHPERIGPGRTPAEPPG